MEHRPSILHRPLKAASQASTETFDFQYEKEQQYWASKQAKSQETQDRLRKSLYPSSADKYDAAADAKNYLDQHQLAKEQQLRQQAQAEQEWARPMSANPNSGPPSTADRPWKATTYTSYGSKLEEDHARRRVEAQIAEENLLAMHQRAITKLECDAAERQCSRNIITDESSFWNLGSTSNKWRAHDRRQLAGGNSDTAPSMEPAYMHAPYAGSHSSRQHDMPPAGAVAAWEGKPMGDYASVAHPPGGGRTGWEAAPMQPQPSQQLQQGMPPPQQLQQGMPPQQRYTSRPTTASCPFATDRQPSAAAYVSHQPLVNLLGPGPQLDAAPQRYSSRPGTQQCPFAVEAQAPQQASPWQGAGMGEQHEQHYGMLLASASVQQQQQQRFVSRPDSQPCPFATDRDQQRGHPSWAPATGVEQRFPWL